MLDGISKDKPGHVPSFKLEEIKEEVMADATDSEAEEAAGIAEALADAEETRARPSLDDVTAEVARIFEDLDQFDIDEFIEQGDEKFSSFTKADMQDALKALAAMNPPKVMIDGDNYKKPI
jgi:hypothetical protein